MSATDPAFTILRRSVEQPAGEAGMWEKMSPMFPKATVSPPTPELLDLFALPEGVRANPVPHVMEAAGLIQVSQPFTVQLDLMHGMRIPTWDERPGDLFYMLFRDGDNPAADGTFPGPTVRVPRGAIFHAEAQGHGPPPHTIHWHGIEPTSMNDGVGHGSMEIGRYTYQWQPNEMGTYFYHCHRNTVQHFEFGLYGLLPIDPPDAFFASIAETIIEPGRLRNPRRRNRPGADIRRGRQRVQVTLNDVPIGAGRDRLRRTAFNPVTPVAVFDQFPGFIGGDPINGAFVPDPGPGPDDVQITFPTDPHAFTIPYDVEALWVLDDRDSVWSDFAPDPFAFFPRNGNMPGVDDKFEIGFFNDFNADYWFVTGVPVPTRRGGTAAIQPAAAPPIGGIGGININPDGTNPLGLIPPALNSGVEGSQIAVNARVGDTILIRCLDAAYNNARITFPVDVVIHAFDGRPLGVPPFGLYNHAFLLPAGVPILICTARRFDTLIRATEPINSFVTVEFIDNQGIGTALEPNVPLGPVLVTALIPFVINPA